MMGFFCLFVFVSGEKLEDPVLWADSVKSEEGGSGKFNCSVLNVRLLQPGILDLFPSSGSGSYRSLMAPFWGTSLSLP